MRLLKTKVSSSLRKSNPTYKWKDLVYNLLKRVIEYINIDDKNVKIEIEDKLKLKKRNIICEIKEQRDD